MPTLESDVPLAPVPPLPPLQPIAIGRRAIVQIALRNDTDRRLRLHRFGPIPVALASDTARVDALAHPRGVVRPGEMRNAPVEIELPVDAPPGVYTGTLEVAGQTASIRLVVPLRSRVVLAPGRVVLDSPQESHPVLELSLANHGNVPITVDNPFAVRMDPRDRACRVLRRGLELATAADKPLPIVDAMVYAAAQSAAADPILAASIAGTPFTLVPGDARLVRLTLRLPDLDRGSYRARLVVAGNPLVIQIHTDGRKGG